MFLPVCAFLCVLLSVCSLLPQIKLLLFYLFCFVAPSSLMIQGAVHQRGCIKKDIDSKTGPEVKMFMEWDLRTPFTGCHRGSCCY